MRLQFAWLAHRGVLDKYLDIQTSMKAKTVELDIFLKGVRVSRPAG